MNTKISYLYRDASNYKVQNECIVRGLLTDAQTRTILDCRSDGEYFIPSQVGLPERRFARFDPQEDHCWFELDENGFEPTDDDANVDLSVDELVSNFLAKKDRWDDTLTPAAAYESVVSDPSHSLDHVHFYQFDSRLFYKDPRFGLDVCSTAGHTQFPAYSEESTEFDIVYASEDYLTQMRVIHQLMLEHAEFNLLLSAKTVGWDEADRETVFSAQLRSENGFLSLQPSVDMSDYIDNIPTSEFQQALAYAWGGFFSKVKDISPHDLDYERRFAGMAAFHDGQTGKEWLQKARNGELRSDLSDIIAKAQKTFEGMLENDQPPQKSPER